MSSPLAQFEIKPIVKIDIAGIDLSFTNSSLWMVIAVVVSTGIFMISTSKRKLIPSTAQAFCESLYDAIAKMVSDNVGDGGKSFFPFVFSLFIFVLAGNILGMFPGAFTFTSHLAVTLALSGFIFVAVTLIGIYKHGLRFFSLFFPKGAPLWTAVILIPIELLSYLSRPISMSVRLFANMTVGHVLLKVVAGFVISLGGYFIIPGIVPLAGVVAISALEIMIAIIQAYVFAILTCVYLHDSLYLH